MLRNLQPPQAGTSSGWICQTCKHKLLVQQKHRPRWQTNVAPRRPSSVDDFIDDSNSIAATARRFSSFSALEKEKTRVPRAPGSFRTRRSQPGYESRVYGKAKKYQRLAEARERATRELGRQIAAEEPSKGRGADPKGGSLGLNKEDNGSQAREEVAQGSEATGGVGSRFSNLISSLARKFAGLSPASKVSTESVSAKKEATSETSDERTARAKAPRFVSSSASSSRGRSHTPKRRSLARMVDEAKERPKWGISYVASGRDSRTSPSFDSLEAADKVSHRPTVSTKNNNAAWGLAPAKSPDEFADTPGDLAESVHSAPLANRTATSGSVATEFNLGKQSEQKSRSLTEPKARSNGSPLSKGDSSAQESSAARPINSQTEQSPHPEVPQDEHVDDALLGLSGMHLRYLSSDSTISAKDVRQILRSNKSKNVTVSELETKLAMRLEESGRSESPRRLWKTLREITAASAQSDSATADQADATSTSRAEDTGRTKGDQSRTVLPLEVTPAAEAAKELSMEPHNVRRRENRRERRSKEPEERKQKKKEKAKSASAASAQPAKPAGRKKIKSANATPQSTEDAGEAKNLWQVMSSESAQQEPGPAVSKKKGARAQPKPFEEYKAGVERINDGEGSPVQTIEPTDLELRPLSVPQPVVPTLSYDLDRVLFNPGVYQLQDPTSRVFNFDPYLQKIMPVAEFDFNALQKYKTSSQDPDLARIASEHGKRYIGSTSSMTSTLAHFHYLLSSFRPLNLEMLSRGFSEQADQVTNINKAPNAIFLRWKDGSYAIDADKEYDTPNVLMMLGRSMEKLLTMPKTEFERYRKNDPREVTEEERTAPESYHYSTQGDFLMRSQLDAYDPRLPGTGMFDLKTRAVVTVRMSTEDFEPMTGYEIHTLQGKFGSYEREHYDMMRSTMLKYMLQVRMGRMQGIFAAYHNVERIFGFQYISLQDMDRALHGQHDLCLGDQEFKVSLEMLNKVFDKATAKYPEQTLRFHFETKVESLSGDTPATVLWAFAEPMTEPEVERIQSSSKEKVAEFERTMMGMVKEESSVSDVSEESSASQTADSVEASSVTDTTAASSEVSVESTSGHSDDEFKALETSATIASTADASDMESLLPDSFLSTSRKDGFNNSESRADRPFIKEMQTHERITPPLFAASIMCKNLVNCGEVERPQKLKPEDKWKVEYLLQEWDGDEAMWARYQDLKTRRQTAFQKRSAEDEELSGEREKKVRESFLQFMRGMSENGREYRGKMEKAEEGREPVVYGWPSPTAGQEATATEDDLNAEDIDVGQYMAWMYGVERVDPPGEGVPEDNEQMDVDQYMAWMYK